jgi:hypothetical protein
MYCEEQMELYRFFETGGVCNSLEVTPGSSPPPPPHRILLAYRSSPDHTEIKTDDAARVTYTCFHRGRWPSARSDQARGVAFVQGKTWDMRRVSFRLLSNLLCIRIPSRRPGFSPSAPVSPAIYSSHYCSTIVTI